MHVTAPASTANLGPGFDTLGLALDLPFELIGGRSASGPDGHSDNDIPEGFLAAEKGHPARVAFVAAGGDPEEPLWWRSPIPPGWGIGFSGAARVAGAFLAVVAEPVGRRDAVRAAFQVAARLEGHPDNAAASAFGGMTVAVGEEAIRVEMPGSLAGSLRVVTWSPAKGTSTNSSRAHLDESTPLAVAASSIGRSALWVAAITSGRLEMLREACRDDLHQPARLAARPDSAAVLETLLNDDAVLAAWLSGSGPTVAALVGSREAAEAVSDALTVRTHPVHLAQQSGVTSGRGARVRILQVDVLGARQVIPD